MLVIRCAACKNKLWKYEKIGKGAVLHCYKDRIKRFYGKKIIENDKVMCSCGKAIGIDKGTYIKMDPKAFAYSGTKLNK